MEPNATGNPAVTPAAPPAAPAAQAVPAAPPAADRAADPSSASQESVGLRQLREQYEGLKRDYEPWQKLNAKPDEVAASHSAYSKLRTEAVTLGQQLGYDANEVAKLFGEDPVKVLTYLRQQGQARQQQPLNRDDIQRDMQRIARETLQPVTERMNAQMDQEAEFKFNSEFDRLYKANFADGLPDKAREALQDMVSDLMGQDDEGIKRLKFEGKVSDIARHFETAKTRLMEVYMAMSQAERNRAGGNPTRTPALQEQPKSRLDTKLSGGYTVRELMNV